MLDENDNDAIPHEYDLELTKKIVENSMFLPSRT